MQAQATVVYIHFGTALRYLQDVGPGWSVHEADSVLDNIDVVMRYLDEFALVVTQRAAFELKDLRQELADLPKEHRLSQNEAVRLSTILTTLRPTLLAEAQGKVAYIVSDKRVDVSKLLENMPALLAPTVYGKLSEAARYDFDEAGKCIAFERPTAAAFHLMRGTEAVLRDYYSSVVKRNRIKRLLWAPMVEHLRERRKDAASKGLFNNLDNIRVHYRNPTAHPEKVYDIDEVQDLFSLSVDVVNRMVKAKA